MSPQMSNQKKYDVYGIGNALVDIEVDVPEKFLKDHQIQKGVMTLIDENRQQELLAHLDPKSYRKGCGGSAANTLIALAQLGGQGFYSCKVANDDFGDFFYQDLLKNGLNSNSFQAKQKGITGKCLVMITPDADRTMNTFLGITQTFSPHEIIEAELAQAEYLYIEGYLLASPTGKAAALEAKRLARKHGVKVSLTLSDPFIVKTFYREVKEVVGDGIDLIFCNEEEALQFAKVNSIDTALADLKQACKNYVVTLGAKGSKIFDGKRTIDIAAASTNAINTNGAGDMYAGAFIYGLTHSYDFAKAGKLASNASAKVVAQFGPRLQTKELLAVKDNI